MTPITPVLLAGGSGKRLWPLSRKSYPKQFSNLLGSDTLFQRTAKRFLSSKSLVFNAPITMTNSNYRFIVAEQLQSVGIDPAAILIEPEARNTAPAALAAAIFAMKHDAEATILLAPSDHIIPDNSQFHQAILEGLKETNKGFIVSFGIIPTRPETGYGYLKVNRATKKRFDAG